MKISIEWLKEFINFSQSSEKIADTLTMLGLEAECIDNSSNINGVIVGEVKKCSKHPNADRLSICEVSDGKKIFSVVCGAPNVSKDQKVAFAPVGTILPGNLVLSKAKIRGETSEGMICSEKELEISDDHEGIMVLSQKAKPGTKFKDYMKSLNETIDLDITPNRPDCFSHLGVARDLSVKLNKPLKTLNAEPISYKNNQAKKYISINFENADDCPRYIAGIVKNVKVGPSPDWLIDRLESIGQRSINNLVDISNYVMMELGQPTHIFDYDKINSKEILIRKGKKGESLSTLDEIKRSVSPNELLITNGSTPLALAGIMGGLESAVSDETKTILIESAYFNAATIRKSAKSLGMSTDASKRFERGADPNASEIAFWRVIRLIEELSIGEWVPGLVDPYPKKLLTPKITLTREKLDILSGIIIKDKFINDILTKIGCKVISTAKNKWNCTVPSWRPDLEREVDLIEEVVRFYGYDKIASKYHYQSIMNSNEPDPHNYLDKIISMMTGLGFSQVFNNSLQPENIVSLLKTKSVEIMNPLSDKMSHLRNSLFPGLLETIDFNYKNNHPNMMIFEWGNIFHQDKPGLKGIKESLVLSGVVHGSLNQPSIHRQKGRKFNFSVLKGSISALLNRLTIPNIVYTQSNDKKLGLINAYSIKSDKSIIGYIGKINPMFINKMHLDINDTFGFQFDLDILSNFTEITPSFSHIVSYPVVERDLNFVLDENILIGDLISTIAHNGKDILKSVEPSNIFRHKSLGENKKSVTINLIFQSPTKTLEDKDVNFVINEIIKVISSKYSAKLR